MFKKASFINRKTYIIVAAVIIVVGVLLFLNSLKYSISDITADNYSKVLKKDTKHSLNKEALVVSSIFADPYIFYDAKKLSFFPNYKRTTYTGNDRYEISVKSELNNNLYTLEYPNEKSDVLASVLISNVDNGGVIAHGKEIVNQLMLKHGFIYMTSELKGHVDILILQYDDYFLIGSVIPNDDGTFFSIDFGLYKRKKFFKSL